MDDAGIHQYLDILLNLRRTCQREGSSGEATQALLRLTLSFVREIMTEEVFARAMRSGNEGEGLLLLANRFAQMEPLMGDRWPSDFTFQNITEELFAIANGDAPRVLKARGKQGRFGNAHALLELKLEAHGWYKVMGNMGAKAADRQVIVLDSYGVTHDAFAKWRQEGKAKLTAEYFDNFLATFLETQMFAAGQEPEPLAWAAAQTRLAGQRYKDEVKANG
jgi:hypothetical protein